MHYRAEVDGLRALAVVPVILFHAGFQIFSGGFVGVDVFFVISGYLITTIIINEMDEGRFSLANFYLRRAKRILPVLFFVMLVCLPFAGLILMPLDMKDFSQSLIAVSTFSSNILFWRESGYFEPDADLKPLLHTWSLAVEEQYYIVFPLLLMIAWRLGRRWVLTMLALVFALSLAAAEWAAYNRPSAAFYLLPTRGWELLIGAFAAFYLQKREVTLPVSAKQAGSFLGLALILYAIFTYDEATLFPGLHALAPTIGTVLVILFATPGTWINQLLSTKAFVGLGLISYSAYLWHQPLFAFTRYGSIEDPPAQVMLALSALTIPLAYLSWRFIEKPFRRPELRMGATFGTAFVAAACFVAIGFAGHQSDGFKQQIVQHRLSDEQRSLYASIRAAVDYDVANFMVEDGQCRIWTPNTDMLDMETFQQCVAAHGDAVIILGDSHAMNLYNIVAKTDVLPFVVGVSRGGCRVHEKRSICQYDAFERFIAQHGALIKKIVYHQSGAYFFKDRHGNYGSISAFNGGEYSFSPENISKVAAYLHDLHVDYELDIEWLGPFLEYRHRPMNALRSIELLSVNPYSVRIFSELEPVIDDIVSTVETVPYTPFDRVYDVPQHAFVGDCFIFRDLDHFSQCGEDVISEEPSFVDFVRDL